MASDKKKAQVMKNMVQLAHDLREVPLHFEPRGSRIIFVH